VSFVVKLREEEMDTEVRNAINNMQWQIEQLRAELGIQEDIHAVRTLQFK
jgi:hypothetical protein